jgi:hypothetical protein
MEQQMERPMELEYEQVNELVRPEAQANETVYETVSRILSELGELRAFFSVMTGAK